MPDFEHCFLHGGKKVDVQLTLRKEQFHVYVYSEHIEGAAILVNLRVRTTFGCRRLLLGLFSRNGRGVPSVIDLVLYRPLFHWPQQTYTGPNRWPSYLLVPRC